jgi:hypothetical protein
MNPDGKAELLKALEEAGLADMVEKAKAGEYSDFASHHAFPMTELVRELCAQGRKDLARRAMDGEFDHDE